MEWVSLLAERETQVHENESLSTVVGQKIVATMLKLSFGLPKALSRSRTLSLARPL